MRALTKEEIISAFSKKDQKKLKLPDLKIINWEIIDYFSWFHPSGHLAFIIYDNGLSLRGLVLEKNKPGFSQKAKMCGWCKTVHGGAGVVLFSTPKVNSPSIVIGEFICADLQCSYYIRGLKGPLPNQMRETISMENKIFRLLSSVDDFFNRSFEK